MEKKLYQVVVDGDETQTETPGEFAGWRAGQIFGTLECKSGMRMKRESRIFFATMGEAILRNYRPCKNCRPMNGSDFENYSDIIPEESLEEFYNRKKK